jgi:hypothetical protein
MSELLSEGQGIIVVWMDFMRVGKMFVSILKRGVVVFGRVLPLPNTTSLHHLEVTIH